MQFSSRYVFSHMLYGGGCTHVCIRKLSDKFYYKRNVICCRSAVDYCFANEVGVFSGQVCLA